MCERRSENQTVGLVVCVSMQFAKVTAKHNSLCSSQNSVLFH